MATRRCRSRRGARRAGDRRAGRLHAVHVTVGLGALALLYVRATRARSFEAMATWTNGISLFWHLVDVLWLFVFSTIWLLQ